MARQAWMGGLTCCEQIAAPTIEPYSQSTLAFLLSTQLQHAKTTATALQGGKLYFVCEAQP